MIIAPAASTTRQHSRTDEPVQSEAPRARRIINKTVLKTPAFQVRKQISSRRKSSSSGPDAPQPVLEPLRHDIRERFVHLGSYKVVSAFLRSNQVPHSQLHCVLPLDPGEEFSQRLGVVISDRLCLE